MHNIRFWQARFYSQEVAIDRECCNSRPSSPSTTGSLARWVRRQFLPRQPELIDPSPGCYDHFDMYVMLGCL